jgi:hypothetical protein
MPIKDGFRSPSGKLPVANARVNNLQNLSEGSKVVVVGCFSAIGVNLSMRLLIVAVVSLLMPIAASAQESPFDNGFGVVRFH